MADSHAKVDLVLERVAAVREACGKEFGIAVDFHGRVHRAIAKVLTRALEPYHLLFIEEPVLPENLDALSEVARVTSMPLATGSGFIPALPTASGSRLRRYYPARCVPCGGHFGGPQDRGDGRGL